MYGKCHSLEDAKLAFDEILNKDVVSWTSMIGIYVKSGHSEDAFHVFEQMLQQLDHSVICDPNDVTFITLLNACNGSVSDCNRVYSLIALYRYESDVSVANAVVTAYAKCGSISDAHSVFENMKDRNVVSWTSLISGYVQHGLDDEALNCFHIMQSEGLAPNAVTFTCILKASGIIGAIDKGKQIHEEIIYNGLLEKDIVLGNALVHMYVECGAPEKAHQVLEKLPVQHEGSWCSVIIGYAKQGRGHEALGCLERMQSEGLSPDDITFVCILTACSHAGLFIEGQSYFELMAFIELKLA